MRNLFLAAVVSALLCAAAERGEEIRLWPEGAPGSEGITAAEVSKPSENPKWGPLPGNFTVTHYPSLYVFLPPKEKANGVAVVIAPGGGHRQLVIERGGWEMAEWLNNRGIAAFVLKYRLAKAPGSTYTLDKEVHADAERAMKLVRGRAKEWGLDTSRIGFAGFSAGGEVAGMIGSRFDAESRPDFNILIYPWYRPGAKDEDKAPLFPIPDKAPTTFMICTTEDRSHVEPTVKYFMELEAKKIPVEMHIYQSGPHGFALRPTKPPLPVNTWPDRLEDWLYDQKILRR